MPPPSANPINIGNSLFVSTTGNGGVRGRLDKPFSSINAAVLAALDGDTVFIFPGIYSLAGTLSINKSICIQSLGVSQIYAAAITPVYVWGGNVVFRDCSIRTDATTNQDAVLLNGAQTKLLFDRCVIYAGGGVNGTDAIGMDNGDLTLRNTKVTSEGANALTLRAGGKATLCSCDIQGLDSALAVDDTLNVESDNCNFRCTGANAAIQTAWHGLPKIHLRGGVISGLPFDCGAGEITVAGTVWDRSLGLPTNEWIPGTGWK